MSFSAPIIKNANISDINRWFYKDKKVAKFEVVLGIKRFWSSE